MLSPKRVKYRKQHRGRMAGNSRGRTHVQFGDYGLKALERGWISNRQIEAARIAMTRYIKRGGKVWINIYPDKPTTQKPAETRMGSGKGNPEGWVAVVKPGRVMFELAGVPEALAREAMRLAGHKLPVKTKFVEREGAVIVPCRGQRSPRHERRRPGGAHPHRPPGDVRLRFRHATGELENTAGLSAAERDLARALTIARQRGVRGRTRAEPLMSAEDQDKPEVEEDAAGRGAPRRRPTERRCRGARCG